MILRLAIENSFMSRSDLKTRRRFGTQHSRVRHGGGRHFWKGWAINLTGWLFLEKEGGRRRQINRCDPFYFYTDVWAYQVNGLSPDYKIIVADSRGHGRSTRTEAPFGYDLMTSDYVALLDHLHIKKVDLVGWSDGGIIGIDMAMSHPERLKHVFAQSANVTTDGVNGDVANGKQFTDYVNWMESEYKRLSPTPNEYKSFVDQIAKMWETQPNWTKAQLSKIKTPILIVAADHDVIWLAHQEYMAKAIPSAKLLVLEDTSHFAMLQDPKGYNQDIIKFFGK